MVAGQLPGTPMDFVVMPTGQAADGPNRILNESLSKHWPRLARKAGDTGVPDAGHRQNGQEQTGIIR
jgi:hypothetical protein